MDKAARTSILRALRGVSKTDVIAGFYRNRYANFDEYALAVGESWGAAAARELRAAVAQASIYQPILVSIPTARQKEELVCEAVLLHMPEPDFRLSVSEACRGAANQARTAKRISTICKRRGLSWEFTVEQGFRSADEPSA